LITAYEKKILGVILIMSGRHRAWSSFDGD